MIYVLADDMTLSHALNYTSSKEGGIDSYGCCGSAEVQYSTFVKIPVLHLFHMHFTVDIIQ